MVRGEETNIGILSCLGSRGRKKLERGFNTEKLKGCSPLFSSMDKRGQNSNNLLLFSKLAVEYGAEVVVREQHLS